MLKLRTRQAGVRKPVIKTLVSTLALGFHDQEESLPTHFFCPNPFENGFFSVD